MFLIDWIPAIVIHLVLVCSAIGLGLTYFVNLFLKFPVIGDFIKQYTTPIQVACIVILLSAVYLEGVNMEKTSFESKVQAAKEVIVYRDKKSDEATQKTVTKYVYKDRVIKEKGDAIEKEIIKYRDRIDANCSIPNTVVMQLNRAADSGVSDNSSATSGTGSTTQEN